MGQSVIAGLNQGYLDDPTGELTLAAAAQAEVAAEREKLAREQAEAAKALEARSQQAPEPSMADYVGMACLAAARGLDAWQGLARSQAEARAETRRSPVQPVEVTIDYFDTRRRQEAERTARVDSVRTLLARNRPAPEPPPEEKPSWWRRHFGTPRKAVLR